MRKKTAKVPVWITGVILLTALGGGAYWLWSSRLPAVPTIAFIPETEGAMLSEVKHFGAKTAAESLKYRLYWNTPTAESDVAGQVSLIDRVARGKYQGLILAPNHPFAVLTPLRRALAAGLPVVVVSALLDLPASDKFGYIVNDDEKMGELAAAEISRLIDGRGAIALVGLARSSPGVADRARGAERFLASRFPEIRVVSRGGSAYNPTLAEDHAGETMSSHPELKAVLSLTAAATRGVYAALKSRSLSKSVHVVGCEQDADLISYLGAGDVAAIVAEDAYRMGNEAVQRISEARAGKPIPAMTVVPPLLLTKHNLNSPEANLFINFPR